MAMIEVMKIRMGGVVSQKRLIGKPKEKGAPACAANAPLYAKSRSPPYFSIMTVGGTGAGGGVCCCCWQQEARATAATVSSMLYFISLFQFGFREDLVSP